MGFELDQYRLKFNKIDPRWLFNGKYEVPWQDTDCKGYWKLDETSGNRADSSGNSNTLTDNNTVLYGTGIKGNAADFESSTSESLSITNAAQTGLNFATDFSIGCWLKPESIGTNAIITKLTANTSGYNLFIDAAGIKLALEKAGNETIYTATSILPLTLLNFIGVSYDSIADGTSIVEIRLNGRCIYKATNAILMVQDSAATFYLGAYSGGAFYDGLMDEACAFNRVLTDDDWLWLYLYGLSKVGKGYTI